MLSVFLALGRLQLQVDENRRRRKKKKHSGGEEEAWALPDLAAAFVVSDSQRVTLLRHQTLLFSLLQTAAVWFALM